MEVHIQVLDHGINLPIPSYSTDHSAGIDLRAAIDGDTRLEPGGRSLVPTGISIALPDGYEGQVRPRSGLALNHGITVLNSPGTIDPDYRGELKVILINLGQQAFEISRGMRIAQLVIAPYTRVKLLPVAMLDSKTGDAHVGFGSTGLQ
jgi:dUTP pyrophosphatase